jgi:hypothetical protein
LESADYFILLLLLLLFNSIRVYLRANITAQRPITKLARVHRNTQKQLKEQNTNYDSLYKGKKLIIIPRKIKVSINRRENKVST